MISTKGRYALRVMLDLAEQENDEYIPLNEISARQEISQKYLEIIIKILVQKKLLKGRRGKGGGYKLTRQASQYSVGEILELAEGTLATVTCLMPSAETCPRKDCCKTLPMWAEADRIMRDYFYSITLKDLADGNLGKPITL